MLKKKNASDKLTLPEYLKLKEERSKKKFRLELYPWPVSVALAIPLIMILGMIIGYIIYIKNISG
jgi:hypothetical protein